MSKNWLDEKLRDRAQALDSEDSLAPFRSRFHIPTDAGGAERIYFCGNSLGLQPQTARFLLQEELDAWAKLGVDGHFVGQRPWYSYHEQFRKPVAELLGARDDEVVLMNSLTVNLHLMLASFYAPTRSRCKIIMDDPVFPSDLYALKTKIQASGQNPSEALVLLQPRSGENCIREEDVYALIEQIGGETALVLLSGVNFVTGQWFDMQTITRHAHAQGCIVGWDLAHAVGNVPLHLHDWNVDFAVWCNYKYVNGGPGAVGGCYVHQRHGQNPTIPRWGGWWGANPATRFQMQKLPEFAPQLGADGWQISNPPIFSLTPVLASLCEFSLSGGMSALRRKSELLSNFLQELLQNAPKDRMEQITPTAMHQRGCQTSLLIKDRPQELLKSLHSQGVICDYREPGVIRIAPVPLYNTFEEIYRFGAILEKHLG